MCLELKLTLVSLAVLVGPQLFSAVLDGSCRFWEDVCGRRGACWLYETHYMG